MSRFLQLPVLFSTNFSFALRTGFEYFSTNFSFALCTGFEYFSTDFSFALCTGFESFFRCHGFFVRHCMVRDKRSASCHVMMQDLERFKLYVCVYDSVNVCLHSWHGSSRHQLHSMNKLHYVHQLHYVHKLHSVHKLNSMHKLHSIHKLHSMHELHYVHKLQSMHGVALSSQNQHTICLWSLHSFLEV